MYNFEKKLEVQSKRFLSVKTKNCQKQVCQRIKFSLCMPCLRNVYVIVMNYQKLSMVSLRKITFKESLYVQSTAKVHEFVIILIMCTFEVELNLCMAGNQ